VSQEKDPAAFHRTVATYRQGARTMPGRYYTSPEILDEERERIFSKEWICAGRAARLQRPGDYFLRDVSGESILFVRDKQGTPRAWFNICRHRGTRLCEGDSGRFSETIQCPYHGWTYGLDGHLAGAPHMRDVEGFDARDYPLHAAAVAEWEGFLFVNLSRSPVPFAEAWAPMMGRLARYNLPGLVPGHRVVYDVKANWKLVFQNYSECLHCPVIHPELATVLPYDSGANDLFEGPFLGGYMEIRKPNLSCTLSGRAAGVRLSPELDADDGARGYYYTLMPSLLLSLHPDYVNYYLVQPVAANRTLVESEWLFHPATADSAAANIGDAVQFWEVTNRQDWEIIERGQRGIASSRYEPGPYSARESLPAAWDRHYLRMMGRA
jgi:Rieske 2Fe-2S family protein